MNFTRHIKSHTAELPIAPMIDVVFLLLIFFIVTWNFARWETELDVTVPAAKEGKESRHSVGEIIVNVKSDGAIVVNRQTLSDAQLLDKLISIAKLYPDQAVILRGDENVGYSHIVGVLDICRQANIWNILFATARPEDVHR